MNAVKSHLMCTVDETGVKLNRKSSQCYRGKAKRHNSRLYECKWKRLDSPSDSVQVKVPKASSLNSCYLNSVALVRERAPLVGEVSANVCG
jgi:hypothetical protein